MSEDVKKVIFEHTQQSYWKGPWYPYWTLIVVTIFGGFFGVDHLYLRSPSTALLKTIINILFLGIWYFYDLIQILGEKNNVMKFGLSAPIVGPLGIGAEMFVDDHPNVPTSKSPFRYLMYMFLLCIPFGFDHLVAGDTPGALAKFLTTFFPLLWAIGIIWTLFSYFRAVFAIRSVFDSGVSRLFPFTVFGLMSDYGPSKLGPVNVPKDDPHMEKYSESLLYLIYKGISSFFLNIGNKITKFFTNIFMPIITSVLRLIFNIALPQVKPAVQAVATTVESVSAATSATADAIAVGSKSAKNIIKESSPSIKNAAVKTGEFVSETASTLAKNVPETIHEISKNIKNADETLEALGSESNNNLQSVTSQGTLSSIASTTPALAVASAALNKAQRGGGGGSTDDFSFINIAIFSLFVFLLGSGMYIAIQRLNNSSPLIQKNKENDRRKRNDSPPKP
jgi:hypothetical protein